LPIHRVNTSVLFNEHFNPTDKLSQLNGITLAAQKDSFQFSMVQKQYPNIDLVAYNDTNLVINQLLNNEIQGIVGEIPYLHAQVSKIGLEPVLVFSQEIIATNLVHGTIAKGQPKLLKLLNDGINKIPQKELIEMEKRWFPAQRPFHQDLGSLISSGQVEWLQNHNTFSLGVDSNWPPYEFRDKEGHYHGITQDYIQYASNALNIKFTPDNNLSWPEAVEELKKGHIDIVSGIVNTPERERLVNFTNPYFMIPTVIMRKKGTFFVDSLNSLSNKRLGIVKGYALGELISRDYPDIKIIAVDSVSDGLIQLRDGNIDAFTDVHSGINFELEKLQITDLEVDSFTPYKLELSMAIRKGLEPLVDILNSTFSKMSVKDKQIIGNNWLRTQINRGTDFITILKWFVPLFLILFFIIVYIIRSNRRLNNEINERIKIERSLNDAKDIAINANQAKSDFLANISHEIRTPMNAVIGMSHLIESEGLTEKQSDYLKILNSSSSTLLMLINDILDLSKIESGKLELEDKPFILNELILNISSQIQLSLDSSKVQYTQTIDPQIPKVLCGDTLRIGQILLNLLSNACKFTNEGSIRLEVIFTKQESDWVSIQVSIKDTGIGMNVEQQSRLFQTYTQADSSITRKYGGTGLGLTITKHLTELMNGSIHIKSSLDVGSEFIVNLRLQTSKDIATSSMVEVQQSPDKLNKNEQYTELNKKQILIVDDNQVNLMVASKILKKVGIIVTEANDGLEAVKLTAHHQFDAILMDLQMPVMDGYTATVEIRKLPQCAEIPIIALSANVMVEDIEKSYQVGMNEHLPKPLVVEQLYSILKKLIVV